MARHTTSLLGKSQCQTDPHQLREIVLGTRLFHFHGGAGTLDELRQMLVFFLVLCRNPYQQSVSVYQSRVSVCQSP
jgi:hypothetical protein